MTTGGRFGAGEYLCYRVLATAEHATVYDVSRSRFLLLSALANRRLLEAYDLDVALPRYWYVYGEVVDEHSLNRAFFHAPRAAFWAGQRYLPADVGEFEFDVSTRNRRLIDEAVERTVEELGTASIPALMEHQYRHYAPNEFVRTYSELRAQLKRTDHDAQTTLGDFGRRGPSRRETVESLLDAMVASYPREDYPEMYAPFHRWDRAVRHLLADEPNYGSIERRLDELIAALARVELRFHHREHVPDARIREWEDDRLDAKEEFRRQLDRIWARIGDGAVGYDRFGPMRPSGRRGVEAGGFSPGDTEQSRSWW